MVNRASNTENILIKSDYNNLIYIDPNSVVDGGKAVPRQVSPENLMIYVNLEADLVSRSVLTTNDDGNRLVSIADGMLNFMSNREGGDLSTKWTEAYSETSFKQNESYQNDPTGQSFGINDINIVVKGANFIPRVTINFVDVRGKTLFESPENSPYNAFFHIPWPIFYLTVKGYYGKAVRYRLHLVSFNSRYDSGSGNFDINTTFVGSTYAYMADITLQSVLSAPYFYGGNTTTNTKLNESTGEYEQTTVKTSKGYRMLRSVYQEYINKNLLPKGFPVRTLGEIITISNRLDKILERSIFSGFVDPKVLAGMKGYEDTVNNFESVITAWKGKILSPEYFTNNEEVLNPITGENDIVKYNYLVGSNKNTTKIIVGRTNEGTLEYIINKFVDLLETNDTFGTRRAKTKGKKTKVNVSPISCDGLKNFSKFYETSPSVGVNVNGILNEIYSIQQKFVEQRNSVEVLLEKHMNEIVKDKDVGIGFEPTIRNIMGVIMANADTYIRLMKDVHNRAMERGQDRSKILSGVSTDGLTQKDNIYPWPEVKTTSSGGKEQVMLYPGSREMTNKLKSDDPNLWPEVEFVENFYSIITKRNDTLGDQKIGLGNVSYVFSPEKEQMDREIGILSTIFDEFPFNNKSFSSIVYEIYERVKYSMERFPFSNNAVHEVAKMEFENIKNNLSEDIDILNMLKNNLREFSNDPNGKDLISLLERVSPYDRYPYYEDNQPTVGYIKDSVERGYSLVKSDGGKTSLGGEDYPVVKKELLEYRPEIHRKYNYPFVSSEYKGYLGVEEIKISDLQTNKFLQLTTTNDFISSPSQSSLWVKGDYTSNLFNNTVTVGGQEKHMLNTPYFHKQLFDDFTKTSPNGKFVGSAYLFLSSLPFVDLDDVISGSDHDFLKNYGIDGGSEVWVSALLKEIGASHYLPYHLVAKWGSIYHRYKKWINEGVDIIGDVDDPIDGSVFYDNGNGFTFSGLVGGKTVDRTDESDVGFHPFYETVYHQILHGYGFVDAGNMVSDYEGKVTNGTVVSKVRMANGVNTWSTIIDESKLTPGDMSYTLLPTNGNKNVNGENFNLAEQENFRVIWGVGTEFNGEDLISYSGVTLPTYGEKFKAVDGNYSMDSDYRKVVDLIAVFKPEILDEFEKIFIDFAGEKVKEEISWPLFKVQYSKFQDVIKDLSTILHDEVNGVDIFVNIDSVMEKKYQTITNKMLSTNNLLKLNHTNPREYDSYVFGGFCGVDVLRFDTEVYDSSQDVDGFKFIELYLGDDIDGWYVDFFRTMNVGLTEQNVIRFRPLVYLYAGLREEGIVSSDGEFINYVTSNIINHDPISTNGYQISNPKRKVEIFMDDLIREIQKIRVETPNNSTTITRGYNDDPLKLELYNHFKTFNDKWTSGNSIGQKLLMEEILFLDRANKDIGDSVYLGMDKLKRLGDPKNGKINLYSAISLLVQDTGFDIRALPSYVNFYGKGQTSRGITPSKTVAEDVFGSFLEVDYVDSSPKIILQYIGPTSKHLEMSDINKKYRYKDDGFDVGNVVKNPIIVAPDVFTQVDFSKSNRVVAFEVSIGDQNQSIFKNVGLDQSTIRNTSESFEVLERLGRGESGSNIAQVDIGLWDIYRQASYQCEVTSMGNMMIQPTMYFYLKNVPMFRGSYWITEVSHSISANKIDTTFKGTRIPYQSLPDPSDSFLASYRPLFDKMVRKSVVKVKSGDMDKSSTERVLVMSTGEYAFDPGDVQPYPGENMIKTPGITEYGVPYNGFGGEKYVQYVSYENPDNKWLRAIVVEMGGLINPIDDDVMMSIVSRLTSESMDVPSVVKWGDIKSLSKDLPFYSTKFDLNQISVDGLINDWSGTEFYNPKNRRKVTIPTLMNSLTETYQGPISTGPSVNGYGISLSKYLIRRLGISDGDVIYFRMI